MVDPTDARPRRPLFARPLPGATSTLERDDADPAPPQPAASADGEAGPPEASGPAVEATGPPTLTHDLDQRSPRPDPIAAARQAAARPPEGVTSRPAPRPRPALLARLDRSRQRVAAAPVRQLAQGIGLSLVGVGLLLGWVVHVSWTPLLDVGLLLVGVVLVVQSRLGSPSRPLIALGVLLALVAAGTWRAGTTLDGGLGRRTVEPAAATGGLATYELGTGELTIDARETPIDGKPLRIRGEVGLGRLVVLVPDDAVVVTRSTVGGGQAVVFGERKVGPGVEEAAIEPSAGTKLIRLDLRVGLGSVEVRRG